MSESTDNTTDAVPDAAAAADDAQGASTAQQPQAENPAEAPATEAAQTGDAEPTPEAATTVDAEPATEAAPAPEAAPQAPAAETTPDAADETVAAEVASGEEPAADETPATEAATPEAAAAPAAPEKTAAPSRPTPRPVPRPVPRPAARPQVAAAPSASTEPAAAHIPDESAQTQAALAFGRVEEDGTVYVTEAAGERTVGQFPGVSTDEAIGLYVRRFLDLQAKVALFEARLGTADLTTKEIDSTLAKLGDEVAEPAAVGDLDGLRARVEALRTVAAGRRAELEQERSAAKAVALAARTEIVEAAEKLASTDPSRIQWKPAGEELRSLLDTWKDAQRNGPRLDRPSEEALWKRFSHARTTFDRERRHFFAELEKQNSGAKATKAALVEEAEKLSTSTEWGATAGAYRDLMARWKAAGRANRKDDDALWARFRAAQDAFFAARDATNAEIDAEYGENLVVKEALLAEAEALVPVKDLAQAKVALRTLQDRWEAAGKVPRGDVQRVEGRMRAVETAVRDAEQAKWTRSNPETRARAEGAAAQLEAAIVGLEEDLVKAQAKGDARKIKDAEAALEARRSWLEQVVKAAEDSQG